MTEWNSQTSQIIGNDIEERRSNDFLDKESNKGKDTGSNRVIRFTIDELESNLQDTRSTQKHRRPPPPRELFRTDSNITLDSDLSSEPHNSPTAWELPSGLGGSNQYLINRNMIEVEASKKATRRSGFANYSLGLSDIKESSFDFEEKGSDSQQPVDLPAAKEFHSFDFEKIPKSRPIQSPKSPIMRSSSSDSFREVSKKVHSQLKRSFSTQENSSYAARRKALTRSIQQWVNSIERPPVADEDDNEALSFLPVNQTSKDGCEATQKSGDSLDTEPEDMDLAADQEQRSKNHQKLTRSAKSFESGQQQKESKTPPIKDIGNGFRKTVHRPSNADLIMMASHFREEHGQSPVTRRHRLLQMGNSQSSELSVNSNRSQSSLEEILMNRDDPEEILLDLGFGSKEQETVDRVPTRFYSKPSKARGMNIGQFINNCHEEEIRSCNDLNIGGGFRSIFGILQRAREGQARSELSEKRRKKSVANAWNKWLNKTVKVNPDDKDRATVKEINTVVSGIQKDHVVVAENKDMKDSNMQLNSCEVVEDIVTSSSDTIVDHPPEETVKQNKSGSEIHEEESKVTHQRLPLPPVREDSEGSIASKKSSSSTLEGGSSAGTLVTRTSDKPEDSLQIDHVANVEEIPCVKETKDHLRKIPGYLLSNTPQESFEFEEVSTASEMMEDERQNLERLLNASKGQLSRAGSAQSDSSGFADDLVDITTGSRLSPQVEGREEDFICVRDIDVQTNLNEFVNDDCFEDDSPFDNSCHKAAPQKRGRLETFPKASEKASWSEDHPKSVIEILKTLKSTSEVQKCPNGHSKRPPLLKMKSVYLDYPEDLPTNVRSTELPSIEAPSLTSNPCSAESTFEGTHSQTFSNAIQQFDSNLSSIDVQQSHSCHPPSNNSHHQTSIETGVQLTTALPSTPLKSNILTSNPQFENGNIEDNLSGATTNVISTKEPNSIKNDGSKGICNGKKNTVVTSKCEIYLAKDFRGLSVVTPSNYCEELPADIYSKGMSNTELSNVEVEHNRVCSDLNALIGCVNSCDIQQPINEMEIINAKQQMALQDILLLHRAVTGYKSELVELEGLSDQIYQMVHSHLTLKERYELGSLKTLRLQVMEEVESIERLLVGLAQTISNESQEDFPDTYQNSLDHLQVLKQMITLLQEQKTLRDTLGSLEVEYWIAYGSVVHETPIPWTSERAELIEQLMDLRSELDRLRHSSQKLFASSLQEMKHDLLKQLRNDVMEETENLRSQLKIKENEVEHLRRQLQITCDGNSNQSEITSHVT
ncbi:uncharacterized protein [Antedon mediterranea]|uniref:uncharacterized protein n=1 Tax=Antedon mediterranea TaxID=105859 RepID=UPI003AF800DB